MFRSICILTCLAASLLGSASARAASQPISIHAVTTKAQYCQMVGEAAALIAITRDTKRAPAEAMRLVTFVYEIEPGTSVYDRLGLMAGPIYKLGDMTPAQIGRMVRGGCMSGNDDTLANRH